MARKIKSLEDTLADINKKYGKGSIKVMTESDIKPIPRCSTGSLLLDGILDGGIALNRMTEIRGKASGGKSTLAMHIIAEAQRIGILCAYMDCEHTFDPVYADKIGINIPSLILTKPVVLEDSLKVARQLLEQGMLVVYDSTNALQLEAELNGEIADHNVGVGGRLMSQACRIFNPLLTLHDSTLIWISQGRDTIGKFGHGDKTAWGRGNGTAFFDSMILQTSRTASIKVGDKKVGNKIKIVSVKNKTGRQFQEVNTSIIYGEGIDILSEIIGICVDAKILTRSGSYIKYIDENAEILLSAQGNTNFKKALVENPEILEYLKLKAKEYINK